MSEETPADNVKEPAAESSASADSASKKKKKKKSRGKKMDHQTRVRILLGAIALSVVAFIFIFMHWLDVVRDAGNPNSENARMGRWNPGVSREEIEADDRRFPLHPSSSGSH